MLVPLLILQIITFIGLIILLRFLFTRHLKVALDRLNTLHEENLAKEEELNEELKRAKEESQAMIDQGKAEAEMIIEETKVEARKLRSELEEEAKVQASKIVAMGRTEAEKMKGTLSKDIQGQSVELASRMIAEMLIDADKVALQYQFVNEIIEEISHLSKEQFNVQSKEIKLISSYPLLDRQRDELKKVLSEKLAGAFEIKEQIDPKLIGGLILDIGGMVIDGTLKNRLQRIIPHLHK
ncbi:MAG: F0F1 ATP synthase subunit delta [Candidatus Omnitrophica bacterium]|nr:F0F1 ATP synthase subunit delta [Candidatus Omnitrophota bacterium]